MERENASLSYTVKKLSRDVAKVREIARFNWRFQRNSCSVRWILIYVNGFLFLFLFLFLVGGFQKDVNAITSGGGR